MSFDLPVKHGTSSSSSSSFLRTCVRAEHSTYLTALSSRASFSPLSQVRARCLFLASFSRVLLSSLRSTWVPTSRKGVRGQWCVISGTHCEEATPREEWGGEEQTPDQLKVTVQSTSVEYKRVSLIHSVRFYLTVDYTSVILKWILPKSQSWISSVEYKKVSIVMFILSKTEAASVLNLRFYSIYSFCRFLYLIKSICCWSITF